MGRGNRFHRRAILSIAAIKLLVSNDSLDPGRNGSRRSAGLGQRPVLLDLPLDGRQSTFREHQPAGAANENRRRRGDGFRTLRLANIDKTIPGRVIL